MEIKMNECLNDAITDATVRYLEEVLSLFYKDHIVEDVDMQVVYDLKEDIIEKYLPLFDVIRED